MKASEQLNKAKREGKLVSAWPASDLETRLRDCLLMLSLHDIISDRENERAKVKIKRLVEKRQQADAES